MCFSSSDAAGSTVAPAPPAITLTEAALKNLKRLREDTGDEKVILRMGVKSGGCSGMSYHMDFEKEENVRAEDAVMEYEDGFKLVCDPKSLLYLFGMRLDYSAALIGGGFQFHNPNAESSCGCGKSFGV
ncbi:FeS cluster assembly accessory/regulatory protein [Coccomyxa subellipsoidea C-169]|uniref:FeS cluster assembly accessory/regulatory protein n=1 Tax=Coccomyxa subellipsoidea (strain C-169) TaxID=574566 RepID=I0YVG2_COCSC|nr:FeS cluster assembly accessory/regulatory protein [Coccomyxa subellipsoidea C-169]EIE22381.1 FeS cluster assembly accessory/regulatory protein [Coccomyxa subellipsoidea C-169]|eukprot:XP_005646925.1 FeS cluster assembly accessory/regulatory protein [Coccomyxa subellipsoidea C-169]